MTERQQHLGTAIVLSALTVVICAASVSVALLLAPALAILIILSLGYFPGEAVIVRIRQRSRDLTRPRPVADRMPEILDISSRVGRLIAYALAVRPPPLISAVQT